MISSAFQVLFPNTILWSLTFISGIKRVVESLFYVVQKGFSSALTILTGKNCFLLSSVQNDCLAASELFHICLHSHLSSIHSIITYYEIRCFFQQVLRQSLGWFLPQHWKTLFLRGFILKPKERA